MRLALALNRLVVIFADISLSHNLLWLLFHFGMLCCKQLRFQGFDGLVGWNCLQLCNLNLTFGLQSLFVLFLVFFWTVKSFFVYIAYYTAALCVFWTAKSWRSYFHYVDGWLLDLFIGSDVSNMLTQWFFTMLTLTCFDFVWRNESSHDLVLMDMKLEVRLVWFQVWVPFNLCECFILW